MEVTHCHVCNSLLVVCVSPIWCWPGLYKDVKSRLEQLGDALVAVEGREAGMVVIGCPVQRGP